MLTRERAKIFMRDNASFAELRPALTEVAAVREAERCLDCGGPYAPAPCASACPAQVDVPTFISAIARGDAGRAASLIFAENLLGGTCARVCPVDVLCEGACVLGRAGFHPIEVGRLQRYATDTVLAHDASRTSPVRRVSPYNGRTVAVIGAGPAGLTCAGELASLGYAVTMYDEHLEPGGLARYAIAPYRLHREPLPAEVRQIVDLGVTLRLGTTIDSVERLREIERAANAVFLGIGLGADTQLHLPGEGLRGVRSALPFIDDVKSGRERRVGSRVAVIGGGNTAIDVAREAVRLGARDVTVLCRESESAMPAAVHEIAEARTEGMRVQCLVAPVRFSGAQHLEAIEFVHVRPADPDEWGRPTFEPLAGTEFMHAADSAIVAIGLRPRAEFLSWVEALEWDGRRIRIDAATGRTTNPKYFAGGDAASGGSTVVDAVRAGKIAARGIDRALREENP